MAPVPGEQRSSPDENVDVRDRSPCDFASVETRVETRGHKPYFEFALQDDIAKAVAAALRVTLLRQRADATRLDAKPTTRTARASASRRSSLSAEVSATRRG